MILWSIYKEMRICSHHLCFQFGTLPLTHARLGSKARVRIPVEEGYAPATVWFLIELKPGGKEERAACGRDEARPTVLNT